MTVLHCFDSMQSYSDNTRIIFSQLLPDDQNMSIGEHSNSAATFGGSSSNKPTASSTAGAGSRSIASVMAPKQSKAGKRPGRKPSKINERDKLERSRQSARECRARKKLRYQYLEELVVNREKAVFALRDELKQYKQWCRQMDTGGPIPDALLKLIVNEDMENKRRQREEAERALKKQQRRQQQEQKTSSSSSLSSASSSSSSSSPPKTAPMSSPPSKSTSPPTSQPTVSMTASSSSSSAVAVAAQLLQQRRQQEQLKQMASRPTTLKTEPPSPCWSQIEHLIPKLSPTQPQQSPPQLQQQQPQNQSPQLEQQRFPQRSQQRATTLKRQMAFDASTSALQKSVQQQLQQIQGSVQKQQQTPPQSQQQVVQQPPRLESQLSIPESVSSFILSNEFSDSGKNQYEYQPPYEQQSSQGATSYHRPLIQQLNQSQITTTEYATPPNFLNVAITNSNLNQRTFQSRCMTKTLSDPMGTDIGSANFLSMVTSPSTCSISEASLPTFVDSRDITRCRSLSNPPNMYSATRQPYHFNMQGISRSSTMPHSSSRTYQQSSVPSIPFCASNNSGCVSSSSISIRGPTLGLFSGTSMLPSTSFPSVVAEESESPSSSDENVNEHDLFQFSSLTPHKRTLSDPILHGGKVRKTAPAEGNIDGVQGQYQPSLQAAPAFFSSSADDALLADPHTTLKNLTTTRCFSSTRTSNTPSPSPSIGLVPMGMASPSPSCSSGSASRSGSFSVSSPAPKPSVSPIPASTCSSGIPSLNSLPSLSSLYDDLSSTLSPAAHAAVDTALDIYSSAAAARGLNSDFLEADSTNGTSLQASIELIPEEFYSYLTDIQEGRGGTDTATIGGSASDLSQSVPHEVNLPDIDELLRNQDGNL